MLTKLFIITRTCCDTLDVCVYTYVLISYVIQMKSQEERHSAPSSLTLSGNVQLKCQSGEFNIWLKLELLKLQLRHRVEVIITVYDKRLQQHIT